MLGTFVKDRCGYESNCEHSREYRVDMSKERGAASEADAGQPITYKRI